MHCWLLCIKLQILIRGDLQSCRMPGTTALAKRLVTYFFDERNVLRHPVTHWCQGGICTKVIGTACHHHHLPAQVIRTCLQHRHASGHALAITTTLRSESFAVPACSITCQRLMHHGWPMQGAHWTMSCACCTCGSQALRSAWLEALSAMDSCHSWGMVGGKMLVSLADSHEGKGFWKAPVQATIWGSAEKAEATSQG